MQKITSKLLKTMIGEEIWTIPQSNNICRGTSIRKQLLPLKIMKVGTKKITLDGKFSANIDETTDSSSRGFYLFLTEEDGLKFFEASDFRQELRYDLLNDMSTDILLEIKELINKGRD